MEVNQSTLEVDRGWWRRERATRTGYTLARCGLVLSLGATVADALYTTIFMVLSDIPLVGGSIVTLFLSRHGKLVWSPMYVGYWLTSTVTIYLSGGLSSPIAGLVFAVLFFGGISVQVRFHYSAVFLFCVANLVGWGLATIFLPLPSPVLPSMYTFIVDVITFGVLGVIVFAYAGAERRLETEYSKEGAANAAKTSFLANVSHELRTPVGAIMGYAELIQDPRTSDTERYEYAETIRRNGEQLTKLVNDLLDLTKIEAGRIEIETLAFSPAAAAADVLSLMRFQAEAKGVSLTLSVRDDLPQAVLSDPMRYKQILLNIVGNAVKFTDEGFVSVDIRFEKRVADRGDLGDLIVEIRDTGRGLSDSQRERLFQPFAQADASTARHFGGSGLGLSLSRKLAQLLGGDLQILASEPGVGSVFCFSLNAKAAAAPVQIAPVPLRTLHESRTNDVRLAGKRILVVDDSSDNRRLIRKYLENSSAHVHLADSGPAAIDCVKQSDFDLVLMDIQMPEMDGLQATETLRRDRFTRPIVALTAHAMHEDRDRCLRAGCDDYMTKPISRADLIGKLETMLL